MIQTKGNNSILDEAKKNEDIAKYAKEVKPAEKKEAKKVEEAKKPEAMKPEAKKGEVKAPVGNSTSAAAKK